MVHYFYHFDYPNPTANSHENTATPASNQLSAVDPTTKIREGIRRLGGETRKENHVSSIDNNTTIRPAKPQNFLLGHVKLFATAVKYQVPGLRHLAASKFKYETTHCEAWKDADFAKAISTIYSSTPDEVKELRTLAEKTLHAHFEELKHNKGIEEVMYNHPSLMYALLKRRNKTPSPSLALEPLQNRNPEVMQNQIPETMQNRLPVPRFRGRPYVGFGSRVDHGQQCRICTLHVESTAVLRNVCTQCFTDGYR